MFCSECGLAFNPGEAYVNVADPNELNQNKPKDECKLVPLCMNCALVLNAWEESMVIYIYKP